MIGLELRRAVDAVGAAFPHAEVDTAPDDANGLFVVVSEVPVGEHYIPGNTWLGFQLNSEYPYSDVYPLYIGRVERIDGAAHGEGVQAVDWRERAALQLSRRSNRWNPQRDTASLKVQKVLRWFTAL
jgi:hypothetical protein